MASSETGGVKAMSIYGRVVRERERLIGMTVEERAWRAKFVKSQILSPEEPIIPKNYYKYFNNPIRRFFMAPVLKFEGLLTPFMGSKCAYVTRNTIVGVCAIISVLHIAYYYYRYNTATWVRKACWIPIRVPFFERPGCTNNNGLVRPKQFATLGFENSVL
ncbi:hypothetical protein WN48_07685 [Eufriesea mexicana]|uniref:Uncharacterized protein n=1 Tax=Eufriesea mexicana TaxID=516756 RepID=A0A310SIL7_9HYME|nr:PREDICTED: uncharacterized protein LOC108545915 [Eufriesea mexicana]XP_017753234.1 PREDICTED: uncharacterized protein LOC108545915 [Eufriesea mexicana]OAD62618.1 hypothetical protein WN48_07685 [Eufriesea mexicana]